MAVASVSITSRTIKIWVTFLTRSFDSTLRSSLSTMEQVHALLVENVFSFLVGRAAKHANAAATRAGTIDCMSCLLRSERGNQSLVGSLWGMKFALTLD